MEFDDFELEILSSTLWGEIDRDHHEPGRRDSYDQQVTSEIWNRVRDEAKQRRLWWAH